MMRGSTCLSEYRTDVRGGIIPRPAHQRQETCVFWRWQYWSCWCACWAPHHLYSVTGGAGWEIWCSRLHASAALLPLPGELLWLSVVRGQGRVTVASAASADLGISAADGQNRTAAAAVLSRCSRC